MESLIATIKKITTHILVLDSRLDDIEKATHHISNFTSGIDARLDEVEASFHSYDDQVTTIRKY